MLRTQRFLYFCGLLALAINSVACGAEFQSNFKNTHDRIWVGGQYWANPMEDWRIADGRLECTSGGANRNLHLLTYDLGKQRGTLTMSVKIDLINPGKAVGSAGFRIGAKDEIKDYRAAALRGRGLDCGVTSEGELFLGKNKAKSKPAVFGELRLTAKPNGADGYDLELAMHDAKTDKRILYVTMNNVPADQLVGNIALVNNHQSVVTGKTRNAARFAFSNWQVSGTKLQAHPKRSFGPILWAMHSLSDSRIKQQKHVLKMTAQMPPLGDKDLRVVTLQIKQNGKWQNAGQVNIDNGACTARFRLANWSAKKDVPYRLVYTAKTKDGQSTDHYYTGTIRHDPVNRPLVIAGFTGNTDYTFPNNEIVRNVGIHNPDVLFFSGDQLYEFVGGYGIIRNPADRSILNYLRKWYLFGWSFGDLMRDRVTIVLPDDHDVYQGNIWGEGGKDCGGIRGHNAGGYAQPVQMVNAVHRTQTSHHPDAYDRSPIARGITVYYGDMVYGKTSFAILADRMFKSGPRDKVNDWKGRPDHCKDQNYDTKKLDKPGLKLLGDRQLKFLNNWASDWRGADMKIVLSQTIFCNLANYHGPGKEFIFADLDSNGWPQTGRNKAVDAMRRGFAFHIAGDQHLTSIVHNGIDRHRDANWSFCVPSIAAGYPRSWLPDKEGRPVANRPASGLPNTGDYKDAFGNHVTVYAVGNPAIKNRRGKVNTAHDKASGYGIVRLNHDKQTITMECWRVQFDANDPKPADQFPGWPKTISMYDNFGKKKLGHLAPFQVPDGATDAVFSVINEKTGQIVYTVRVKGNTFKPWVYEKGTYTVKVGDPDTNQWTTYKNMQIVP